MFTRLMYKAMPLSLTLLLLACGGGPDEDGPAAGRVPAPPAPQPAPAAKPQDTGSLQIGDWLVVCAPADPFAAATWEQRAHCRIEKPDFKAVATVDERGPLIVTSRPAAPGGCEGYAIHAGVDGQAIEFLLPQQKLGALRNGAIFAREYQGPLPPCRIGIEKTGLVDFPAAYDAMLARWADFKETAAAR